jgi:hypothetical protein
LHEISQQGWEPVLALEDQGLIQAFHSTLSYSLERIMNDMPKVPFRDHVWPNFLRENALRLLKRDA